MPTYYGVFNGENFHPVTGQRLRYHYVEVEAGDKRAAMKILWQVLGRNWTDVFDEKPSSDPPDPKVLEWWKASNSTFMPYPGGAPYLKMELPSGERVRPGETMTLRVVLTEAMAKENALFIAGRCVAHRPGPMSPVEHGHGVWFEENQWPKAWNGARTFSIGGAGVVVLVRYVPKADAEAAVAADEEHVSIVPGTTFRAWLGVEPHDRYGRRELSGQFTGDMLHALSDDDCVAWDSLLEKADAARSAVLAEDEELGDRTDVYELENGRVVGVRIVDGLPDEVGDPSAVSGFFDAKMVEKAVKLGMGFEKLRGDVRRFEAGVEAIKCWRDRILGYEVEAGRVIGVRMASR